MATTKLSPREKEVAALVSQGLQDKEIAAQLGIGPRTARHHLDNILSKTGFQRRTQVAHAILTGALDLEEKWSWTNPGGSAVTVLERFGDPVGSYYLTTTEESETPWFTQCDRHGHAYTATEQEARDWLMFKAGMTTGAGANS